MICLLTVVCMLLGADDLTAQVAAQLTDAPVVRGSFIQEQHLQGFKKALHASGHFLLVRDKGILWDTEVPVVSRLTITRERIVGARPDGRLVLHMGLEQGPMQAINGILFALLAGDLSTLRQAFAITGSAGASWKLVLVPQDAALARIIRQITLEGEHNVRQIAVLEASGDSRSIVLQHGPEAPVSAAEKQRLE